MDDTAPEILADVILEVSCVFGTSDVLGLANVVGVVKVGETACVRYRVIVAGESKTGVVDGKEVVEIVLGTTVLVLVVGEMAVGTTLVSNVCAEEVVSTVVSVTVDVRSLCLVVSGLMVFADVFVIGVIVVLVDSALVDGNGVTFFST